MANVAGKTADGHARPWLVTIAAGARPDFRFPALAMAVHPRSR